MSNRPLFTYYTAVYDPKQDQVARYEFRAMTDAQAIQQSKDGYTGLLGNPQQDHLEVTIIRKELGPQ